MKRLSDVIYLTGGSVIHRLLFQQNGPKGLNLRRRFPSKEAFQSWLSKRRQIINKKYKERLTPHEYYITQEKGNERAWTGEYWHTQDIGRYDCKCCTQRLFLWEHKYKNRSGYPTFWNSLQDSISFKNDYLEPLDDRNAPVDPILKFKVPVKRAVCSNVRRSTLKISLLL